MLCIARFVNQNVVCNCIVCYCEIKSSYVAFSEKGVGLA